MSYVYHKYANIFPLIEGDEFSHLVDDIAANGLMEPIMLYNGEILDGRNRYRACIEAGVTPRFEVYEGDAPLTFVISKNRHRRHLTSSQLAAIAIAQDELLSELEDEARRRQLSGLKNQDAVPEMFPERGETRETVAKSFGTNPRYVQDMKRVKQEAPELVERVAKGELSVPQAVQMTRKVDNTAKINAMGSSESNEYYTPKEYIEAARRVMGSIDTDPASNPMANEWIGASQFYTIDNSGLDYDWFGNVWLNPPYGGDASVFAHKLIDEWRAGRVTQAVLLVSAGAVGTKWFSPLWEHTLCFTDHRIRFVKPTGEIADANNHSSVIVYIGDNVRLFVNEFGKFGYVVKQIEGGE